MHGPRIASQLPLLLLWLFAGEPCRFCEQGGLRVRCVLFLGGAEVAGAAGDGRTVSNDAAGFQAAPGE